jgi:hypothetical protein
MVALAVLLGPRRIDNMDRRIPTGKKNASQERENVCGYCLFFQPYRPETRPARGNCTHHKEWIENASLTTCSDMSSRHLEERGIYQLIPIHKGEWTYLRRTKKVRTRLFSVK